jgi:hypothetical protein
MRVASIVTLLTAVLTGSAPIPATAASGGLLFLQVKPPSLPKAPLLGQPPAQRSAQGSRVVCGMTLIPVDPKIDAAIRHPIPENGPKFTIQTILPPACRR